MVVVVIVQYLWHLPQYNQGVLKTSEFYQVRLPSSDGSCFNRHLASAEANSVLPYLYHCFVIDSNLAVCSRAPRIIEKHTKILYLISTSQVINDIIDKV